MAMTKPGMEFWLLLFKAVLSWGNVSNGSGNSSRGGTDQVELTCCRHSLKVCDHSANIQPLRSDSFLTVMHSVTAFTILS